MKINPKIYHVALISYCLAIFAESSIPGNNFPKVDFEFGDKIIHFLIYSVLYVLFFYSLKNQSKYINLQKFALEYSILFTALFGLTDEIHQYFVPYRSCELYDWIADAAGAIIMYIILKYIYQKKKSIITVLFLFTAAGCSGPDNTGQMINPKINIASEECWLDLMPTTDADKNIFGFFIKLSFTGKSLDTNYVIKDFTINLNNDVLKNRKFTQNLENKTDSGFVITISHTAGEKYLDKNKSNPEEAEFSFRIIRNGKSVKSINTEKIKILKTY